MDAVLEHRRRLMEMGGGVDPWADWCVAHFVATEAFSGLIAHNNTKDYFDRMIVDGVEISVPTTQTSMSFAIGEHIVYFHPSGTSVGFPKIIPDDMRLKCSQKWASVPKQITNIVGSGMRGQPVGAYPNYYVFYPTTPPTFGTVALGITNHVGFRLYVPDGSVAAYQAAGTGINSSRIVPLSTLT